MLHILKSQLDRLVEWLRKQYNNADIQSVESFESITSLRK
jgi:hypothetical protein